MSFGSLSEVPSYSHQLIHAVSSILFPHEVVNRPHAINEVRLVKHDDKLQPISFLKANLDYSNSISIKKHINTRKKLNVLMQALSSTVENPTGTAYFAKSVNGGKVLIAKTGTFDTDNKNIRDKYFVGLLIVNEEYYTFSILIGSEDYTKGLIKNIKNKELMLPILQDITNALQNKVVNWIS